MAMSDATASVTNIFIACFPKSGSTYLRKLLCELTGYPHVPAVQFYGHNEQDLFQPALRKFGTQNTVTQQHVKGTRNNVELMKTYGIRPIVLVRNIYDVVLSLHDHFEREGPYTPAGYVHREYGEMTFDERIEYLIRIHLPWYFNFLVSWREAASELDTLRVSYDEFFADPQEWTRRILDFYRISMAREQIGAAIAAMTEQDTRLNVGVRGRGCQFALEHRRMVQEIADAWRIDPSEMERIGIKPKDKQEEYHESTVTSLRDAGPPDSLGTQLQLQTHRAQIARLEARAQVTSAQREMLQVRLQIANGRSAELERQLRSSVARCAELEPLGAQVRTLADQNRVLSDQNMACAGELREVKARCELLEERAARADQCAARAEQQTARAEQQAAAANHRVQVLEERSRLLEKQSQLLRERARVAETQSANLWRHLQARSGLAAKARSVARRVRQSLLQRSNGCAWNLIAPEFQQLKDDTLIANSSLHRYRLQLSEDLAEQPFLAYPLTLEHTRLSGVLLAPVIEGSPSSGELGIELVSPHAVIVRQAAVPLHSIDPHRPARIDFAPLEINGEGPYELRVFVRAPDCPVRLFEWRRSRWAGLHGLDRRPFCGFASTEAAPAE